MALVSSASLELTQIHSFSWLSNIPLYICTKLCWQIYLQERNGDADIENRLVDTVGERESGTNGESSIKMYTLLLSRFSRVRLCATPETAAHQASPSLGFSRQEHWSGLPFPSPMHKVKSESEVAQSSPTLSSPVDCSLPGSSIHGIFQARVLEWGAIAFSEIWGSKYFFKVQLILFFKFIFIYFGPHHAACRILFP